MRAVGFAATVLLLQLAVGAVGQTVWCRGASNTVVRERSGTIGEQQGPYGNNMDCSLRIEPTLEAGEAVVVEFTMANTEQNYDFVEVYSPAGASTPTQRVSGTRFVGLRVEGTSLRVRFTSDSSVTQEGYEARYWVRGPPTPAPPTPAPLCRAEMCGANGYCEGDVCRCFDGWSGEGCATETECPARVRRSWYALSTAERSMFQAAVRELKRSGEFDVFAQVHNSRTNSGYAHGTSGFLPWHRQFLWEYENALRELGGRYKCVTVPYWAWELDAGLADQTTSEMWEATPRGWGAARDGCTSQFDTYFEGWVASDGRCLDRDFTQTRMVGQSQIVELVTGNPTYGVRSGFRERLEGAPHANPHIFVAGHMQTFLSPDDPVFFMHHANVDRIWALWQDCHDHDQVAAADITAATYQASGTGGGELDVAMPFARADGGNLGRFGRMAPVTPREMHSLDAPRLGYRYADDDGLASLATMRAGCSGSWAWFGFSSSSSSSSSSSRRAAVPQDIDGTLPSLPVVADFVAQLRSKPTKHDIHTAAVLECLAERPSPLPAKWVHTMLGADRSPEDFPLVCHGL